MIKSELNNAAMASYELIITPSGKYYQINAKRHHFNDK